MMTVQTENDEVAAAVEPVVAGLGFELVEVQCGRAGRRRMVRILADRPDGGIQLADCARISRALSAALDATRVGSGPYTLEVSSPGLDRPLRTVRDYRRYLGERITLHLQDGHTQDGRLTDVDEDHVVLDGDVRIPHTQVKHGTRNY